MAELNKVIGHLDDETDGQPHEVTGHEGEGQEDDEVKGQEDTDPLRLATLACGVKGYHETEYSTIGEADLHRALIDCDKNPGHHKFIPVTKFGLDNLPDGYKDEDIVQYIKCQAELTVRLTTDFTSSHRPPGYAFHDYKGKQLWRVGSGFVQYMYSGDERTHKPCPCPECKISANPKLQWGMVKVRTATHVVFDKDEATKTVVELFYDENKGRDKVKFLYGETVRFGAIPGDWCDMRCVTHDLDLLEYLKDTWGRWRWLETKVNQKYPSEEDHKLVAVVSHPHGCSKQISIGTWHRRQVVDRCPNWENCVYFYDTPTCPGSSGAPVWIMGKMRWGGFFGRHPHSGRPLVGYNISGVGWDRIK